MVRSGRTVLSSIISSQAKLHDEYGGVVPELASRQHVDTILPVIDKALDSAGVALADVDGIAVTYGPGLAGALLVGLSAAKALALASQRPLVGINHLEAHIYAAFLEPLPPVAFPAVCLVVSGGHTDLMYMSGHGRLSLEGETRDDAAGEVFDKLARAMHLGYPGGPLIDKLAQEGDARAFAFPRAYLEPGSFDFSFSGLKTAVLMEWAKCKEDHACLPDLCASFQAAVVEVLVDKSLALAHKRGVEQIVLGGGVAANSRLRQQLRTRAQSEGMALHIPAQVYCTDNAAMVAAAGSYSLERGQRHSLSLNAKANLSLGGGNSASPGEA